MTKLSEKLADLSVLVGDIEARAEAFRTEQQNKRDDKIAALKSEVEARQAKIKAAVQTKGDGISVAWSNLNDSMKTKAAAIQAQIEAKKDAIDADRANRRAEQLELNARRAVDFAMAALGAAELAAIEAFDARMHADALSNDSK